MTELRVGHVTFLAPASNFKPIRPLVGKPRPGTIEQSTFGTYTRHLRHFGRHGREWRRIYNQSVVTLHAKRACKFPLTAPSPDIIINLLRNPALFAFPSLRLINLPASQKTEAGDGSGKFQGGFTSFRRGFIQSTLPISHELRTR